MGEDNIANNYEEARKHRLLDNKRRFEDLGIMKISKTLSDLSKSQKKSQPGHIKQRSMSIINLVEPRRSSRARNPVPSYRDDIDIELPTLRRRSSSKTNSSWTSYLARPLDEVKSCAYEERIHALKCAEKLQINLESGHPSFVKSMVRSHVYSCFWLGLPTRFCEDYLPKSTENMVLEDENGTEYEANFISKRTGLSGGWRAFALDHKLDDGDALVFELTEPTRFKIYIVKASNCSSQEIDDMPVEYEYDEEVVDAEKASPEVKRLNKKSDIQSKNSIKSKKNIKATRASTRKRNRQ